MSTAQVGGAEYEHERYRGVLNVRGKRNGDVDRLQAFANGATRASTDADPARRGPRAVARDWTKASRNRLECPALMSITSNASVSAGQSRSRPSFNSAVPSPRVTAPGKAKLGRYWALSRAAGARLVSDPQRIIVDYDQPSRLSACASCSVAFKMSSCLLVVAAFRINSAARSQYRRR
jgi:hypothetical protein